MLPCSKQRPGQNDYGDFYRREAERRAWWAEFKGDRETRARLLRTAAELFAKADAQDAQSVGAV
jgi:hypothetical protein